MEQCETKEKKTCKGVNIAENHKRWEAVDNHDCPCFEGDGTSRETVILQKFIFSLKSSVGLPQFVYQETSLNAY